MGVGQEYNFDSFLENIKTSDCPKCAPVCRPNEGIPPKLKKLLSTLNKFKRSSPTKVYLSDQLALNRQTTKKVNLQNATTAELSGNQLHNVEDKFTNRLLAVEQSLRAQVGQLKCIEEEKEVSK